MMDESVRVWAAPADEGLWLRIEGRAMADVCPALRSFCEAHLDSERPTLFVDLCGCNFFDSTFLGTLLCLQKLHGRPGGPSVVLVAPSETCEQALRRMSAHLLFPFASRAEHEPPAPAAWKQVAGTGADRATLEFQQQVVDAHNELATVPGPLGDLYRPIARLAERELVSRQSPSGGR
jgi:anti-anti-sigma regulatory factor